MPRIGIAVLAIGNGSQDGAGNHVDVDQKPKGFTEGDRIVAPPQCDQTLGMQPRAGQVYATRQRRQPRDAQFELGKLSHDAA